MYHLDSDDIKLECDAHHLWKDSRKLPEYWNGSHESQDVSTWYFMTVTQTNPNTPVYPVNEFAHADKKICQEKKHSQTDPFYKFGIYMKDILGSISSFSWGKKSGWPEDSTFAVRWQDSSQTKLLVHVLGVKSCQQTGSS